MQKYGTSKSPDARALIVIRRNHQIIGIVRPPQIFMATAKWQPDTTIIEEMAWRIAPAIKALQRSRFDQGLWPHDPVRSIKKLFQFPDANGAGAIALPLPVSTSGFTQSTWKTGRANDQSPAA